MTDSETDDEFDEEGLASSNTESEKVEKQSAPSTQLQESKSVDKPPKSPTKAHKTKPKSKQNREKSKRRSADIHSHQKLAHAEEESGSNSSTTSLVAEKSLLFDQFFQLSSPQDVWPSSDSFDFWNPSGLDTIHSTNSLEVVDQNQNHNQSNNNVHTESNPARTLFDEKARIWVFLQQRQLKQLSGNRLKLLPHLAQITVLCLYENNLKKLPPEIGLLENLRVLSARQNELVSIPPQISSLTKLELLYLQKNQLTTIPMSIAKLNPRLIDLSDNPLDGVDGALSALVISQATLTSTKLLLNYCRARLEEDNSHPHTFQNPASTSALIPVPHNNTDTRPSPASAASSTTVSSSRGKKSNHP